VVDGWPLDSMSRCIPLGTRNLFTNFRTLLRTSGTSAVTATSSVAEEKKDEKDLSEEIIEDMIARTAFVRSVAIATSTSDSESKAKERSATLTTDSKINDVAYPLPNAGTAAAAAATVIINKNARTYAADCFFGDNIEGLSIAELIADCLLEVYVPYHTISYSCCWWLISMVLISIVW
jgi:hypothetical protein